MSNLPSPLSTGKITGRFIVGILDDNDSDDRPNVIPASGSITFKASIGHIPIFETAEGPVTMFKPELVAILDDEGYLCTPDPLTGLPLYRGVYLVATDTPSVPVQNWTWLVSYRLNVSKYSLQTLPSHAISVLSDSEEDLTKIIKVPASPPEGISQIEAAARRMEAVSIRMEEADELIRRAEDAADRAEAPTDQMLSVLFADPESLTRIELESTFANKSVQDLVETGRLSLAALGSNFANKETQTTVHSGRLSESSLITTIANETSQFSRRQVRKFSEVVSGFGVHRSGGGDAQFMPSGSIEAARSCIAMGAAFIDVDARATKDGTLIMVHDTLLEPSTTGRGAVANFRDIHLGSLKFAASNPVNIGGAWSDVAVPTFNEYLDALNGTIPITVEIKHTGTQAKFESTIAKVAQAVHSRGLTESVSIQIHTNNLANHGPVIKAAGLLLGTYGSNGSSIAVSNAIAAGVDWVLLERGSPDSVIAEWVSTDKQIVGYCGRRNDTVGSPNWWAERGVFLVLGDNASYAVQTSNRETITPWGNGLWGDGDIPNTATRPTLMSDGIVFGGGTEDVQALLAGNLGPLPATFTLEARLTYQVISSSSWFGIHVCAPTDVAWANSGSSLGYLCAFWSSGGMRIWERSTGTQVDQGVTTGSSHPLVANEIVRLRIIVTATSITAILLSDSGIEHQRKTFDHTLWRGGYVHVVGNASNGPNRVKVLEISVT